MKDFLIEFISHENQRYDTLGDYKEEQEQLNFRVSDELPEDYQFLVMIHELIEAYLCKKDGVKWEDIDDFDRGYESNRIRRKYDAYRLAGHKITVDSEPGDCPVAPYFSQHQFASAIERILCNKLGIPWAEYERECNRILNEVVDHKDRH